jgi:5-methylcytosine-specific restriction endonuclease McrBC regulatory subunit McrC
VGQHMDQCYTINTNAPKIQVQDTELKEVLNLFLIHHFLGLVRHITRNGLKKGFTKVSDNLTAKIRGKILVNPTLRHNHTKARPDKVYCQYQRFTTDCLENQILASTLEAVQKRLNMLPANGKNKNGLSNLLHQVKPYFDGVQRIPLNNQFFRQLKTHRFFRTYQQALDVAEQIHKNITQTTEISGPTFIHPFTIDMPELFERYCEAKLRAGYSGIKAGYQDKATSEIKIGNGPELRPDFVLSKGQTDFIIDSKYKFWFEGSAFRNFKSDFQQLALYAKHEGIMKNLSASSEPHLIFIYPNIGDESENAGTQPHKSSKSDLDLNQKEKVAGFSNIYKIALNLPTKPE